jgi:hypothetical protein
MLCQFEAWCNLQIINIYVKEKSKNTYKPRYGCENGFSAFVTPSMILDNSVYIYEALKLFGEYSLDNLAAIKDSAEYSDLKVIRNNIHTFYKVGGYKNKAKTIVTKKLSDFKMDKQDISYPLRSDISLIFQISDRTRNLIGSDYFFKHCIYETNNREWEDMHAKRYATFVKTIICGFSEAIDETAYNMISLPNGMNEIHIELFDYKSADLFARVNASHNTIFRLLLTLSQISYGILMVELLIDKESTFKYDLWVCYLTKMLALKYDEAFDNLISLLTYSDAKDITFIENILKSSDIDICNLKARQFAQELRNTIHYQNIKFDIDLVEDSTTASWIKAIYLSNSTSRSMNEFREFSDNLLSELKLLQQALQNMFNLDKTYHL